MIFQLKVILLTWLTCFVGAVAMLFVGRGLSSDELTFTGWGMSDSFYRIYTLDINRQIQVTLSLDHHPYQYYYGWSEDGHFAFLSDHDGNTEVYLWDGADLINISQHSFHDWRPTISRDGRVAFASERDGNMEVYVWDDGTLTNVSQAARSDDYPVWGADGRLAWGSERDGNSEIMVWDGVNTINASQTPDLVEYSPVWGVGPLMWMVSRGPEYLGLFTWDGENVTEALPNSNQLYSLVWGADGRIAYSDYHDIYVWDDGQVTNVTNSQFIDEYTPTWSSDGRLAFISFQQIPSEVYIWDGSAIQRLTYNQMSEEGIVWRP